MCAKCLQGSSNGEVARMKGSEMACPTSTLFSPYSLLLPDGVYFLESTLFSYLSFLHVVDKCM